MAPEVRLLSVAEIARRLGVPESTVHYWKNRFAQHLPSQGSGRQKRFRPEAVDVFRVIAEMFSLGHSTQDVMETLGKRFPLTASLEGDPNAAGTEFLFANRENAQNHGQDQQSPAALADTALRMAAVMGQEMGQQIARSIAEGLRGLGQMNGQSSIEGGQNLAALPALDTEQLDAIKSAVDQSCTRLDAQSGEVARMAEENAELKTKLSVLETELVRLRKDRREMEKYLLDKIKSMST